MNNSDFESPAAGVALEPDSCIVAVEAADGAADEAADVAADVAADEAADVAAGGVAELVVEQVMAVLDNFAELDIQMPDAGWER